MAASTASGLDVKNEAIALRMRPWRRSSPRPRPGSPMLLEMIVRSVASEPCTSASIRVRGAPTSPKPPTMIVAPSGISRIASAAVVRVAAIGRIIARTRTGTVGVPGFEPGTSRV